MDSSAIRIIRAVALILSGVATCPVAAQSEDALRSRRGALVVLIGGMDSDPTPEQIAGKSPRYAGNSGLYRLRGDLHSPIVATEYFNWNGTRASRINSHPAPESAVIAETIRLHVRRNPRDFVILVGNSWGGHTIWEVCRALVDSSKPVAIDYVVFLDPSSAGRSNDTRPKHLPININRATNFYTRNLFGWRRWPNDHRIENVDLGDAREGFLTSNGPAYNSTFDFNAHVAAEWDERIHSAIRKRILDLIGSTAPVITNGKIAVDNLAAP